MKVDKRIRLTKGKLQLAEVVREQYLRDDLPCHVSPCDKCAWKPKGGDSRCLDSGVAHFVIPDCQVAMDYCDILTHCQSTGVILLQSVISQVDFSGGKRSATKLKSLLKCPGFVKFHNEFSIDCFLARSHQETLQEYHQRLMYKAACWYYTHLSSNISIVILSNDEQMHKRYSNLTIGVFVMTLEKYITDFIRPFEDILEQYESLRCAVSELPVKDSKNREYEEHLQVEVLAAGVKSGRYVKGFLHVNKHNPMREAFVSCSSTTSSQTQSALTMVFISGIKDRNRAIDGDVVAVEVFARDKWHTRHDSIVDTDQAFSAAADVSREATTDRMTTCTGKVVGVLQRNWREYVATFPEKDSSHTSQRQTSEKVLVIPWDYRIPKIRISTRQAEALRDHRIVVSIDSWEMDSFYPNGHFVRSLGPLESLDTKMSAILIEYSLKVNPFGDKIMSEMPVDTTDTPWKAEEGEDFSSRKDLRKSHLVFSIDPPGCEDVDDALSIRELKDGHLELGVHIADVSYFVHPDSATDQEAKSRSTSVYFPHRRYDMLPSNLSAHLCSLLSNVDRYAVSVLWHLDEDLSVIGVWYGRTILRSAYKLEYKTAQLINDGKLSSLDVGDFVAELKDVHGPDRVSKFNQLHKAIVNLMRVADHFQRKRFSEGAIHLESTEAEIVFNEKKEVDGMKVHEHMKVHETIAECMIMANRWVAKRIKEAYPGSALLRHHPPPRQESFDTLQSLAKLKGFKLDPRTNKHLERSLSACHDPANNNVNMIFRNLCIQSMNRAMYQSTGAKETTDFSHYGLALDVYTHFTSPIRRYADIIVHRQLLSAVEQRTMATCKLPSNRQLDEICENMNFKHKAATDASKDAILIFTAMYFQSRSDPRDCIAEGTIYQMRMNGFLVFLPRFGLKGAVLLKDKEGKVASPSSDGQVVFSADATLQKSTDQLTVIHPHGQHAFQPFDTVQVKVSVVSSRAHADNLRYELFSFKQESTAFARRVEVKDMIEEDLNMEEEEKVKREAAEVATTNPLWMSEYRQTDPNLSLYHLLEEFQLLAISERPHNRSHAKS